ncbi:hypothetical protein BJ878DRAFT_543432 [Calycina marina]|uniref:Uncharacterized protein n=1 Tax=Calycina marina TaxID=1763456 RepID=A0A9P8CFF9_9HELO|nr:hypothetical protein BJ878DRAFT_543432 [Calycina marina]
MAQPFLPLVKAGGRLVNIASSPGVLVQYSGSLKAAIVNAPDTCVDACTALMEKFKDDVAANNQKAEESPSASAETPVLLGLSEIDGKTGGFWKDGKIGVGA